MIAQLPAWVPDLAGLCGALLAVAGVGLSLVYIDDVQALLGTAYGVMVLTKAVIFGGLLASYVMHRIGHPEWAFEAEHTNVWFGGGNTIILLTSSLSAVLAHQASETGDGKKAAKYLWLTIGGAIWFVITPPESHATAT